jgi:hypothetical protein
MRRTARLATGVAVLGVVGFVGAPAAIAQTATCNSYSGTCVESDVINRGAASDAGSDRNSSGVSGTVSGRSSTPASLPFTGGEVLLLGFVGAGALAAGTVLVAATRRRGVTTA